MLGGSARAVDETHIRMTSRNNDPTMPSEIGDHSVLGGSARAVEETHIRMTSRNNDHTMPSEEGTRAC